MSFVGYSGVSILGLGLLTHVRWRSSQNRVQELKDAPYFSIRQIHEKLSERRSKGTDTPAMLARSNAETFVSPQLTVPDRFGKAQARVRTEIKQIDETCKWQPKPKDGPEAGEFVRSKSYHTISRDERGCTVELIDRSGYRESRPPSEIQQQMGVLSGKVLAVEEILVNLRTNRNAAELCHKLEVSLARWRAELQDCSTKLSQSEFREQSGLISVQLQRWEDLWVKNSSIWTPLGTLPRNLQPTTTKEPTTQVLGVKETEEVIPLGRPVGVVGYFALQSNKLVLKKLGRTPGMVAYGDVGDLIEKLEMQNRGMWWASNLMILVGAGMISSQLWPDIRRRLERR